MARENPIKTNFTAGVLDPRLYGRTDIAWYYNGCEELQNMIALPHGPAIRRSGTRFLVEVKDSATFHRVLPFEFSKETTQVYTFEFGDGSLRLIRERGQIVVAPTDAAIENGDFDGDLTGWDDHSTGAATIEVGSIQEMISRTLGTAIGDLTTVAGLAAAFDGETNEAAASCAGKENTSIGFIGKNWGAGNTKTITGFKIYGSNNIGLIGGSNPSVTVTLQGSSDNFSSDVNDLGSLVFTDSNDESAGREKLSGLTETTAYQYHRLEITRTGNPGDEDIRCAEVQFFEHAPLPLSGLVLIGNGTDIAWAEQDVTTTNTGQEHVLVFKVLGDPGDSAKLSIGTTSMGGELISDREFPVGSHAVAFTPSGSPFYVQFKNTEDYSVSVDDVALIASGAAEAVPFELATPYATADLPRLKLNQTFDVVYLFHPERPQHRLERRGDTTWSLVEIAFIDGPYLPENTDDVKTLQPSGTTGEITVTAAGHAPFVAGDVGRLVRINHAGTWGYARITGHVSSDVVDARVLKDFGATTAQPSWRLGLWSAGSGYPAHGTIHEERLAQGGAAAAPDRVDGSKIGAFEDYTPGTEDDDAFTRSVAASRAANIFWLISAEVLLVGTLGREVRLVADDQQSALTPANVRARKATTRGCADLLAVEVGDVVLFVQRHGRQIRELAFTIETDGYRAPSMTRRAQHLFLSGVRDMAYQEEPWSVLWVVLADGTLLGLTYVREEEVVAWHKHPLGGDGKAESVTVVPGATADEVHLVVRRTIDGQTKRYIEVMETEFDAAAVLEDAFFVDGGLTYDGAPATAISGLDHLEGETVQILADGAVHPARTVAGGQITLQAAASKVHVGLGYQSRLKPVRFDAGATGRNTAQGRKKRVVDMVVRLNNSLGFKVGRDDASLEQVPFRKTGDAMGQAVPLFTGDRRVAMPSKWERAGDVLIVQDQPLPLEVVSLMPTVSTSEG